MSERAAGNIYDLGYRGYVGERFGRRQTFLTLYFHSLRASFGFGRRTVSKLFPMAFAVFAFIPALIQLGVGAFTSAANADIEIFAHEDYLGFVQIILLLFCATTAPELAGRDQRTRTLSLYFSRSLKREDYALAKLAALITAMLVLTLGPQALLYIGNGLSQDDVWGYITDEWDLVLPIVITAVLISTIIASIGLAVGAYVPRRSYATVAILAAFIIPTTISGTLMETVETGVSQWSLLLSPNLFDAFTLWVFGETIDQNFFEGVDFHGSVYLGAGIAWAAVGTALLIRRFRRIVA